MFEDLGTVPPRSPQRRLDCMAEQSAITLPSLLPSEIWACKLLAEHHAYLTRPMMWRGSSVLRCSGYPASGSLREHYSRSLKVGNQMASILKSNVKGITALFGLNPVSNFFGA